MPEIPMRRRRFYITPAFVFNESGVTIRLPPTESWHETVAPTLVLGPVTLDLSPMVSWHVTGGHVGTAFDIVKERISGSFIIVDERQDQFTIAITLASRFER